MENDEKCCYIDVDKHEMARVFEMNRHAPSALMLLPSPCQDNQGSRGGRRLGRNHPDASQGL